MYHTVRGTRSPSGKTTVWVDGPRGEAYLLTPLDSMLVLGTHYDWGNLSQESCRLAAAMLFDVTEQAQLSANLSGQFTVEVIHKLNPVRWEMTHEDIRRWVLATIEREIFTPVDDIEIDLAEGGL